MNVQLLIVDPQVDFTDPNGSLSVKGADKDMDRLAVMVKRLKNKLDDIHVSLDCHKKFDVAHPIYWQNSSGNNPKPFTTITVSDVESGVWAPTVPSLYKRSLEYVRELAKNNRYALTVWPMHCLIGDSGGNVDSKVFDALQEWSDSPATVNFVSKGSNPFVEHYSLLKAEVVDPEDPTTQLNTELVNTLMTADIIAVAGEASSHCVANSLFDVADSFGDDSYVQKIVFLKDASSPVTGFENLETEFLNKMTARGMKVSTTKDFLA